MSSDRLANFALINQNYNLSEAGLRVLIKHFVEAVKEKGVKKIETIDPDEWCNILMSRVGAEPMFRLLWCLCRAMNSTKVLLAEVLCIDPPLFVDCIKKGDIKPYYNQYPNQ